MNLYFSEPIWDDENEDHRCPHTAPNARTVGSITVKDMIVIDAPHATYRLAHFGGTFIVAKPEAVPKATEGWYKIEVYCLWFGHRLKTRGLMFKVDMSKARVRKAKTCDVVFNIAK
jgi:hypothetical protein